MHSSAVRPVRVWVVGFGTVGRWLVRALDSRAAEFRDRYGVEFEVVAIANRRDGFVYSDGGIELGTALALAAEGASLQELPGTSRWATALEGMGATDADVLVDVSASPAPSGEPGRSHLEEALGRGIAAVTSNKWPMAVHGVELTDLAQQHSVPLRAESTVMSGTPALRALTDGLAGAAPVAVRGVLNATANFVLDEMSLGRSYSAALADAQRKGLAERDPSADVDGHDTAAKLMILAALVLRQQLRLEDVDRRGISSVTSEAVERATSDGLRFREVATLEVASSGDGPLVARVQPEALAADDPLAQVSGTDNAVVCQAAPLGEVTIAGPGAGLELAGQGVLSDLLNVAGPRIRG